MTQNEIFLDSLLENKKINKTIYDEYVSHGDVLSDMVRDKVISESDRLNLLSSYLDVPIIDLDYVSVPKEVEGLFPIELMMEKHFVPLSENDHTLIVATPFPNDVELMSVVRSIYGGNVEFALASMSKVDALLSSFSAREYSRDALQNIEKSIVSSVSQPTGEINVQNAPSVKFVDSIIREAIPLRASDIHIEPREDKVVIRYRIDGDLVEWTSFPIESYPEVCARLKILSNIDIAEKRVPQDGRINMNIGGEDINFRVSTLPTIHGEKFVIRVLDNKIFSYSLKELEFSKGAYDSLEKILKHPHGIILLTGPTGSGKTTTLYAFIREINDGKKNIVTIEDPVEYDMAGINQLQVNRKANLTFASSLRSILRQDPDIIMVGEIRDEETAQIATRAAITGHLVLSSLHTNDAVGALVRLIDMGIPKYLAIDAMIAVVSQRLVKKLCPNCRKKVKANESVKKLLNIKKEISIYEPVGCPYCNGSGYKGRTAVHEILYFDGDLKAKVMDGELSVDSLKDLALKHGMISLKEACKSYVLDGTTSLDEYISLTLGDDD